MGTLLKECDVTSKALQEYVEEEKIRDIELKDIHTSVTKGIYLFCYKNKK